jgi:hypothetical protein
MPGPRPPRRAGGTGTAVRAETTVGAAGGGTAIVGTSASTGRVRASSPASSARTKVPAVGQRSSGFFAVHLRIARRKSSGTVSGGGIGSGSCTCFIMIATGVSAAKGTRPVSIS